MGLWRDILEMNLLTVVHTCAAVAPRMAARGRGTIVNFGGGSGSASDLRHAPPGVRPFSPYSTAKAAVLRFTDCLAAETREHGVSVFAMSPGIVRTGLTENAIRRPEARGWLQPIHQALSEDRALPPERSAALVLFLASGRADALSGRYVHVSEDVEALVARADQIQREDLQVLRLRT